MKRLPLVAIAIVLTSCASGMQTQRAAMIATIRRDVATAPRLAADPWFVRALAVVASLPREAFVPHAARRLAYVGTPLQIGWDQTISDPHIVAVMTAAARIGSGSNVLEIGTGSGYQAAVLSRLGARVATIEIVPQLADRARATLARLRIGGVTVRAGDGFVGWPERAPFDAVIVTAGATEVPAPLLAQLRPGGRLVMPIGPRWPIEQILTLTKRADGGVYTCSLGPAMFVPLTGEGRRPEDPRGLSDRSIPLCYGAPVT
ncbi:protein-L-isoaspartate(D-aspartate) O-methyltransferase [Sphingomonas donggukensis]|uniref:Protein-L-isoaspartate O-methyltransferase n=1 Tax=Sphingomonas donggukensis TaxID=2949093 RepID=A0ABY4TR48_9SPHN|nr:protein-L-isoaspartate(D-aspartate) O-methyltransferase [Sphingomonas donggukensis]URW74864.1 protein-L-isoaspartate(D-aspartate) O-methyltransferase [Sphingomonas donggukensis]